MGEIKHLAAMQLGAALNIDIPKWAFYLLLAKHELHELIDRINLGNLCISGRKAHATDTYSSVRIKSETKQPSQVSYF